MELSLKGFHNIDLTFGFLLIGLNRTSIFNIYLAEYIVSDVAKLNHNILKYLVLPATEMATLWLLASLYLSSKRSYMRQQGHNFLHASTAEVPVKSDESLLRVLQITHYHFLATQIDITHLKCGLLPPSISLNPTFSEMKKKMNPVASW